MTKETKQQVFDEVVNDFEDLTIEEFGLGEKVGDASETGSAFEQFRNRYAAALPCKLPVIPKSVGEYIKGCQTVGGVHNLIDAFTFTQGGIAEKWIYEHSDTFALAWLLNDWEVQSGQNQ